MLSGDEFYDDEVTSGLSSEDRDDLGQCGDPEPHEPHSDAAAQGCPGVEGWTNREGQPEFNGSFR